MRKKRIDTPDDHMGDIGVELSSFGGIVVVSVETEDKTPTRAALSSHQLHLRQCAMDQNPSVLEYQPGDVRLYVP